MTGNNSSHHASRRIVAPRWLCPPVVGPADIGSPPSRALSKTHRVNRKIDFSSQKYPNIRMVMVPRLSRPSVTQPYNRAPAFSEVPGREGASKDDEAQDKHFRFHLHLGSGHSCGRARPA